MASVGPLDRAVEPVVGGTSDERSRRGSGHLSVHGSSEQVDYGAIPQQHWRLYPPTEITNYWPPARLFGRVTELLPVDQKSGAPCLAPTELAIDDSNHGDVLAARAGRYACDDRGVVDESALAPARSRLPQDHAVFP